MKLSLQIKHLLTQHRWPAALAIGLIVDINGSPSATAASAIEQPTADDTQAVTDAASQHGTPAPVKTRKARRLQSIVVTSGSGRSSYQGQIAEIGSFTPQSIHDTPASISQVTRSVMDDQQARLLSDVVRNDASVQLNDAATGYYEGLSIRGFPLDQATGYQINGLTIAGEQNVALENKQSVDILKGESAFQNGVGSPGGIIDYETKRPADVHSLTIGTDAQGSRYYAGDFGWLARDKNFGIRLNFAHEAIHSPIQYADGQRNVLSLAADWKITARSSLQLDAEWQRRSQISVNGYQLLGGTTLPGHVSNASFIGYQPWVQPTTFNAYNLSARYNYSFGDDWRLSVRAGSSWSDLNDNMAYAYGCYYQSACSNAAGHYFSAAGGYDIYDYRMPVEDYRNNEVQALLFGDLDNGPIHQSVTVGVSAFQHKVVESGEVYDYVGSGNIYSATPYYPRDDDSVTPAQTVLDSRQFAVFGSDQLSFGQHWQLSLGGREVFLREKAFDSDSGSLQRDTRQNVFLPQTALVYKPTDQWMLYASYSKGLSLGNQAPWWATNANQFFTPYVSRQTELGAKWSASPRLSLNAALFDMTQPFSYARPDSSEEGYTYVREGSERHLGAELSAAGEITDHLRITSSLAYIHATASGSGYRAYDGVQVINQPRLKAAVYAHYDLPWVPQLSLLGGVNYSSRKSVLNDASVQAPAFVTLSLGASLLTHVEGHALTFRLSIDNLTNRFYWADAGASGGDMFLYPGQPRTARLSAQYNF